MNHLSTHVKQFWLCITWKVKTNTKVSLIHTGETFDVTLWLMSVVFCKSVKHRVEDIGFSKVISVFIVQSKKSNLIPTIETPYYTKSPSFTYKPHCIIFLINLVLATICLRKDIEVVCC